MAVLTKIKLGFAGVGGVLITYLGGMDTMLEVILALLVIDYLTGVLVAIYDKKVSSSIGYKGIIKKVVMLLLISMSYYLSMVIDNQVPIRELVIMFFIANEGISILENASNLGLPIPEKIIQVLEQVKGRDM